MTPSASDTIFASVPGSGSPMLPVLRTPWSGLQCVTGDASDNPKPSTIRAPVSSSKRRVTSLGNGADPEIQALTLVRSKRSMPRYLLIALYCAGTPGNTVTACRSMSFTSRRVSRGSGTTTIFPATATGKFMPTVMPKTWKNGSADRKTSRPGSTDVNHARICSTLLDRLRCVRTAPFERPVVPPVY